MYLTKKGLYMKCYYWQCTLDCTYLTSAIVNSLILRNRFPLDLLSMQSFTISHFELFLISPCQFGTVGYSCIGKVDSLGMLSSFLNKYIMPKILMWVELSILQVQQDESHFCWTLVWQRKTTFPNVLAAICTFSEDTVFSR